MIRTSAHGAASPWTWLAPLPAPSGTPEWLCSWRSTTCVNQVSLYLTQVSSLSLPDQGNNLINELISKYSAPIEINEETVTSLFL